MSSSKTRKSTAIRKQKSAPKAKPKSGSKAKATAKAKAKAKPAAKPKSAAAAKPKAKARAKSKYTLKTTKTVASVPAFIDAIANQTRRDDARVVLKLMQEVTGEKPAMWGPSIVGFGKYHYRYDSGHEGDMCIAGFSPRSTALVIYAIPGFDRYTDIMARLGKHSHGKSCLYVKRLADIDVGVLRELIVRSIAEVRRLYPDDAA